MSEQKENKFPYRIYTKKELRVLYRVSHMTFYRWCLLAQIGAPEKLISTKKILTITQVRIIVSFIGEPGDE